MVSYYILEGKGSSHAFFFRRNNLKDHCIPTVGTIETGQRKRGSILW